MKSGDLYFRYKDNSKHVCQIVLILTVKERVLFFVLLYGKWEIGDDDLKSLIKNLDIYYLKVNS